MKIMNHAMKLTALLTVGILPLTVARAQTDGYITSGTKSVSGTWQPSLIEIGSFIGEMLGGGGKSGTSGLVIEKGGVVTTDILSVAGSYMTDEFRTLVIQSGGTLQTGLATLSSNPLVMGGIKSVSIATVSGYWHNSGNLTLGFGGPGHVLSSIGNIYNIDQTNFGITGGSGANLIITNSGTLVVGGAYIQNVDAILNLVISAADTTLHLIINGMANIMGPVNLIYSDADGDVNKASSLSAGAVPVIHAAQGFTGQVNFTVSGSVTRDYLTVSGSMSGKDYYVSKTLSWYAATPSGTFTTSGETFNVDVPLTTNWGGIELVKNGTGTIILSADNQLADVTVNDGSLNISNYTFSGGYSTINANGEVIVSDSGCWEAKGVLAVHGLLTLTGSGFVNATQYEQYSDGVLNYAITGTEEKIYGKWTTLDGTLNLIGINEQSGTVGVLYGNTITGDFAKITAGGSDDHDFLTVSGTVDVNQDYGWKQYLVSYGLTWFADSDAHGNFTLADGGSFNVATPLTDVAANTDWDGKSLTKNGAGTLTLSAVNTFTGSVTVSGGVLQLAAENAIASSSAVNVRPGATLALGGVNQNLRDLVNNGVVDFVNLGRTLTVDNLSGSGTFRLDVDIHGQRGDLLDVTGASAGSHYLNITNQGEIPTGSEKPLQVVKTADGAASFSGTVNSGMFRFSATIQKGADIDEAKYDGFTVDENSWYVTLLAVNGAAGSLMNLNDLGGTVLNSAAAVPNLWFAQKNNLTKRMGELRNSENGKVKSESFIENIWVRGWGQQTDANINISGVGKFRETQYGVDFGGDKAWSLDADHVLYTGLFAGYGGADRDFKNGYEGSTDSGYGGLYATWIERGGWYADFVAKGQYFRNKFDGADTADYDSVGAGASLELGKQFVIATSPGGAVWFVEPSAQVAWLHLMNDDYATVSGIAVDLADADILQFHGGARAGFTAKLTGGGWLQPYVKGGAIEQISTGGQVRAQGYEWRPTTDGLRWMVGAGLVWQLDANNQLHLDYEASFGDRYEKPWGVNAGYRRQF